MSSQRGGNPRHSYEYVADVFTRAGCKLLSKEYVNSKTKLYYECVCGNKAFISFNHFQRGQRCRICRYRKSAEKNRGPNSPHWKDGRSREERLKKRSYPEYKEWRRKVYARDDYTCQVCFTRGGKINAHHLESFADNELIRTDVNNGITLCESCHKEYHKEFGWTTAKTSDFIDFSSGEYRSIKDPPFAGEEDEDAYAEYCEATFG